MTVNKDNFIEAFIKLSIEHGENYDDLNKIDNKLNKKLTAQTASFDDFLAKDIAFAKNTLDFLIKTDSFYVMVSVAWALWKFNYRMKDCYRLFEKIISNKEKKHGLSVIAAEAAFDAIKEGRLKRRKEYPKLD